MLRSVAEGMLVLFAPVPSPVLAPSDLPLAVYAGTHAFTVPWYPAPLLQGFDPSFTVGTAHGGRARGRDAGASIQRWK
jgi:hypothetical protein